MSTDWKTACPIQSSLDVAFVIRISWLRNKLALSQAGSLPQLWVYCSPHMIRFTNNFNVVEEQAFVHNCPVSHSHQHPPMKSSSGPEKWKPDPVSQRIRCETLCLHLNGANLPLNSNRYQLPLKIIDYEFDFLSPNMIMLLLSGCLQMRVPGAGIQRQAIIGGAREGEDRA